ncbi:MAG: hypothetical protein J6Y32_00490 [Bacteroidales bacterium]|nr:hypothetical protein [Bacteroidales bacterium]
MKKTLILLAAACLMQLPMTAQNLDKIRTSVEKAMANTENPKKASNPDTWTKLAKEYVKSYEASIGSGILNTPREQVNLVMDGKKPLATENVTAGGNSFLKDSYATADYYYRDNILMMIVPTALAVENPLEKAVEAYQKAFSLDEKGKKTKEITDGLNLIAGKFNEQAFYQYQLGNLAQAAAYFEKSGDASAAVPGLTFDGSSMSNAGLLAFQADDMEASQRCFEKCLANGFPDEDGKVYLYLSEIASKKGGSEAQIKYLQDGFQLFPSSQPLILGLINAYRNANKDPKEIFVLLEKAKANDPSNAALYSTEGDIHKELKEDEQAIACYRKATEVDASFPYGWVGEGLLLYDRAIEYATQASELPMNAYKEYDALVKKYEETIKSAIDPFEKAFEMSSNNPKLQSGVAEYLKNIYYRFASDDEKYMTGYKKYNEFLKNAQ